MNKLMPEDIELLTLSQREHFQKITDLLNNAGYAVLDYKTGIKEETDELIKRAMTQYKVKKADAYSIINGQLKAMRAEYTPDISDILEGATKGKIGGQNIKMTGHGEEYWKTHTVGTEAVANMGKAAVNHADSLKTIRLIFPKSYDIFIEMMGEMGKL